MAELSKQEKYELALRGDSVLPDGIPDLKWRGKMEGPIADFCISMIVAGYSDKAILDVCRENFGGPKSKRVISRLRDTHKHVIAERIAELSEQVAQIPIAHKAYRLQLLDRMVRDLQDRWDEEIESSTPSDIERLTRSMAKALSAAHAELEGTQVQLSQQNIYVNAVEQVDPNQLNALTETLSDVYNKICDMIGVEALSAGDDEVIDAEFVADAGEDDE